MLNIGQSCGGLLACFYLTTGKLYSFPEGVLHKEVILIKMYNVTQINNTYLCINIDAGSHVHSLYFINENFFK